MYGFPGEPVEWTIDAPPKFLQSLPANDSKDSLVQ